MNRPTREEYQRAVVLARAAIRAQKERPRIRADRTPQAELAKMQAKQAKGEVLTEADFGAMAAALWEQENRKQRGRGRPKGARDHATHGALRAAIWAVQESGLQPYRNDAGPGLSQCDAIADAMKAEGYRTLCSYDAAKREMIVHRRTLKGLHSVMTAITRHMQEHARELSKAFEPLKRQMQEAGRAFAGLGERIRAQTTFSPEALQAIKKYLETKR